VQAPLRLAVVVPGQQVERVVRAGRGGGGVSARRRPRAFPVFQLKKQQRRDPADFVVRAPTGVVPVEHLAAPNCLDEKRRVAPGFVPNRDQGLLIGIYILAALAAGVALTEQPNRLKGNDITRG